MRVLSITLIVLFCLLQYKLWFSSEGIIQTLRLNYQVHQQQKVNHRLAVRNRTVANDIRQLQSKSTVESLARKELGMVKNGETYYQFVHNN